MRPRAPKKRHTVVIPVTQEWGHMYEPPGARPFHRMTGRDDFVTYSESYSEDVGEPVWFYSSGNARWLRCPIGRPGDRLNGFGDRIAAVTVKLVNGAWAFVVAIEEGRP